MIRIVNGDIHLIDLQTRMPFKYGIATMTRAPHAFVRVRVEIDGSISTGIAADHLPPKWFTKIPDKALEVEIDEMLRSIEHAVQAAIDVRGESAYEIWKQLEHKQSVWGGEVQFPPLLSNFGTTLVERALVEALAKHHKTTFANLVRTNALGLPLSEFDDRLRGLEPRDLLPASPQQTIIARHTVGLADPLTDDDIPVAEQLNDGLPQSLVACIKYYGLRHFKLKLNGDLQHDLPRLSRITNVLREHATKDFAVTMDGNETFRSPDAFRGYWEQVLASKEVSPVLERLLFIEQPFHRDIALDAKVLAGFRDWKARPATIIDESDSESDSLQRALSLGYCGTSHKNCKGVFRGLQNACLLARLRQVEPNQKFVMSGEDLANIGPVALLQDLAVAATLGVESVERNGHHYFAGLSAFPEAVQQQVLSAHGDLYETSKSGWPTLSIRDGRLDLGTINKAPLGVGFDLDVEQFTLSADWRRRL